MIEAILNHSSGTKAGVAGTYNRSVYADEVKKALRKWDELLMDLLNKHIAARKVTA